MHHIIFKMALHLIEFSMNLNFSFSRNHRAVCIINDFSLDRQQIVGSILESPYPSVCLYSCPVYRTLMHPKKQMIFKWTWEDVICSLLFILDNASAWPFLILQGGGGGG
jgi:hypothetical protein